MNDNKQQQSQKKRVKLVRFNQALTLGGLTTSVLTVGEKDSKADDMELVPAGVLVRHTGRDQSKMVVLIPFGNVQSAVLEES